MLQVKQRARLFSKTTCSYACVASWQYSFYNTTARLIHLVFKFAIVSIDLVTCIPTFYKLHSFCNTLGLYHCRLIPLKLFCSSLYTFCILYCLLSDSINCSCCIDSSS